MISFFFFGEQLHGTREEPLLQKQQWNISPSGNVRLKGGEQNGWQQDDPIWVIHKTCGPRQRPGTADVLDVVELGRATFAPVVLRLTLEKDF